MPENQSLNKTPFEPVIDRFDKEGWHLQTKLIDRTTVATVREYLEARILWLHSQFEIWVGTPLTEQQPYSWHQAKTEEYEANGISQDLSHYLHGEFDLETRMDSKITEILASNRCQEIVSNFLGTDRYFVHYPPMIRFKLPGAPASAVPVHQDFAYNGHLSRFMTIWMPFVDVDEEVGGLIVYEGSQASGMTAHGPSGAWANKSETDLSSYTPHHVIMDAGDALMFPPTLLHGSAPHHSKTTNRLSIDFRVFPEKEFTTRSYYDPKTNTITRQH